MQFYSVMQSLIRYTQEKFNSIVFKVRSFVSLCWYQNDESHSQVDDTGAISLPQECIRDDEHAGKQIKQTNMWKGLTRTLNSVILILLCWEETKTEDL